MRRESWSGISAAIVLVATVGVAAQEPSTSQNSPQPAPQPPATAPAPASATPQSPQNNDARRISVAGCLQAAPSGPTGTSGNAAPAPAPSPAPDAAAKPEGGSGNAKLVLVNAVPSPAGAAANPSSSSPQTYRLIANEAALTPHIGKKLELTGTVDDQNSAPRSANDSSAANAPQLRVEAGKVIAETCTP